MIKFAVYFDAWGSHQARKPKIALEVGDITHSIDAIQILVPVRSDTTGKRSFVLAGEANEINIEDGKATVK